MVRTPTWLQLLVVAYGVSAADLLLWPKELMGCGGAGKISLMCGGIPAGVCCIFPVAGSGLVLSGFFMPAGTKLVAFLNQQCGRTLGEFVVAEPDSCTLNNHHAPWSSAIWNGPAARRDNAPKEFRLPNAVVVTKDTGERMEIPIPAGEHEAYARLATEGNLTAVLEYARMLN